MYQFLVSFCLLIIPYGNGFTNTYPKSTRHFNIYEFSTPSVSARKFEIKAASTAVDNKLPLPSNVRKTMKAARAKSYGAQLIVEDINTPQPGQGQVLVQIYASGVCHTDIHAIDGDWGAKATLPLTPGHEGCGVVVAVGPDVHNLKLGDRVGIPWLHSTCQACEYCLSGWETLCPNQKNTGFSVPGGLAEYALADAINAIPIPAELGFGQVAPLLCAGLTSYKALKETEARPGEFVTIIGAAGGLGHLAVQYAVAMGLRVIALDMGKEKLDYCKRLGAEFVVDVSDKDSTAQVIEITKGGSHGVLCLATQASAFESSIYMTRRKGTVVLVGLPKLNCELPIVQVVLNRLTVRGSIVGTRKDMQEALDYAVRGKVKCQIQYDKLDSINSVVNNLRDGKILGRVVINLKEE